TTWGTITRGPPRRAWVPCCWTPPTATPPSRGGSRSWRSCCADAALNAVSVPQDEGERYAPAEIVRDRQEQHTVAALPRPRAGRLKRAEEGENLAEQPDPHDEPVPHRVARRQQVPDAEHTDQGP